MLPVHRLRSKTVRVTEPVDLIALAHAGRDVPSFYWENRARGLAIAALGAAAEIRAAGAGRFEEVSRRARAMLAAVEPSAQSAQSGLGGPILVGGFGFSDRESNAPEWREFPSAWMFIPRFIWVRRGAKCTLTMVWEDEQGACAPMAPAYPIVGCNPPSRCLSGGFVEERDGCGGNNDIEKRRWCERVVRTRAMITAGDLQKAVLSRRLQILADSPIDPAPMLRAASRKRPSCFNFSIGGPKTRLVGSSPELLVRVENGTVVSGALAGSAARDADPAEDRRLGAALLASAKNRQEHQLVVAEVRSALEPLVHELQMAAEPELMRLPEAHHLYTPVRGRLAVCATVTDIAARLHPTPAVCGVPRESARAIIEREEPWRGWYTGLAGWTGRDGNGEFAVVLRAGVIEGRRMTLWAGAGIVAASDPEAEFAETEAKIRALGPRVNAEPDA